MHGRLFEIVKEVAGWHATEFTALNQWVRGCQDLEGELDRNGFTDHTRVTVTGPGAARSRIRGCILATKWGIVGEYADVT